MIKTIRNNVKKDFSKLGLKLINILTKFKIV